MPRYKPQERNALLLPVVLSEQIVPGIFAFALDYLVDHELDLSELDARFINDEVGASAYDPRAMFKIVLVGYSQGLIGRDMFAIDGVKLASNGRRVNRKGQELKTNVTDPDSAKMATSKGVIQGYAAQAAVDGAHQVIVAADVIGSGSEQEMLLPMIEQSQAIRAEHTLITADAGYHSDANVHALMTQGIPALIADNQMRQRDERFLEQGKHKAKDDPLYNKQPTAQGKVIKMFKAADFNFIDEYTAICPAGKQLASSGTIYTLKRGYRMQPYKAQASDCKACALRGQCMKTPKTTGAKTITRFHPTSKDENDPAELMRRAIDSARGRQLYSQRIGTVEPVFGNIRHNKRLNRFTLRGQAKVGTQWKLFCLVHNIEKLAGSGYGG